MIFLGRSNVGKSSLINRLCWGQKKLARTSSTPGRERRSVNFYRINETVEFVDLPGYGWAKVPRQERASWGRWSRATSSGGACADRAGGAARRRAARADASWTDDAGLARERRRSTTSSRRPRPTSCRATTRYPSRCAGFGDRCFRAERSGGRCSSRTGGRGIKELWRSPGYGTARRRRESDEHGNP